MNKPSIRCSDLPRLFACPGSFNLINSLPFEMEVESEDAAEGTMLHSVMAGVLSEKDLSGEQLSAIEYARKQVEKIQSETELFQDIDVLKEEEMKFSFEGGTLTGHADLIVAKGRRALIVDYKFGRNAVEKADVNHQLRGYAVLVADHVCVDDVTVVVVQPRVKGGATICNYSKADLAMARAEINDLLFAIQKPDAPIVPGALQCKYCDAKQRAACGAAMGEVTALVTVQPMTLTGQSLSDAYAKVKVVKDICKSIEDRAKAELMRDPSSVPGFCLKQGRKSRAIKDPQAAFNAVSKVIDGGEFASCCKVSIPSLEELYRVKAGCPIKTAKQEISTMLNGLIEETVSAPTIEALQ